MRQQLAGERGSAMVLTLGVLTVLALLAVILMSRAVTEKRTTFAEYTNSRSFYSADAAGEAGVNWLRRQYSPPEWVDTLKNVSVSNTFITLEGANRYKYNVQFQQKYHRPGWSIEYKDYEYNVDASGASANQSSTELAITVMRLYREGY